MRRAVALIAATIVLLPITAHGAAGDRDLSFGGNGVAYAGGLYAAALVQPDGKLVFGIPSGAYVDVWRLTADGAFDATFGSSGVSGIGLGGSVRTTALARQPDGKILVAGGSGPSPTSTSADVLFIARLDAGGTLDSTFDGDGIAVLAPPITTDGFDALVVEPDGGVVAAALGGGTGGSTMALVRFLSDGSPDAAYGTGGIVTQVVSMGTSAAVVGLVRQPDGKLVASAGGGESYGTGNGFFLYRFDGSGAIDPTFGSGGTVQTILDPVGIARANAIALQPDGRIVAVGRGQSHDEAVILRYDDDGSLDATFGTAGMVSVFPNGPQLLDDWRAVALQSDGRIVVAGFAALARLEADGTFDAGFGDAGLVTSPYGQIALIQPDGKIVTGFPTIAERVYGDDRCAAGPLAGCRGQTSPGKGLISLRHGATDAGDRLGWKWSNGEATTFAEFGDPLGAEYYRLCITDGTGAVIASATMPAGEDGGPCGSSPCWRTTSSAGYRYVDRERTPHGISKMKLTRGGDGAAKALVQGSGSRLTIGTLGSLSLPLRVQLQVQNAAGSGACWEATYSSPIRNDAGAFIAKGD